MSSRPEDGGAGLRAALRRILGRPGSFRRWLAGSIVWFAACLLLYAVTANPFVLGFAVVADIVAFIARWQLIGDEDEFNAELARTVTRVVREGLPEAEDDRIDPADWFTRKADHLTDAPPPPAAETGGPPDR